MPFTIDGQWIPTQEEDSSPSKKVSVRVERRKKNLVTVVSHINTKRFDLKEIAAHIKKELGVGGTIQGSVLEFQGSKEKEIKSLLITLGIKI